MDKSVTELRLQQWFERIQNWGASGLSKKQWCAENNIKPRMFFYWQNRIRLKLYEDVTGKREAALSMMSASIPATFSKELTTPSFTEIPMAPIGTENRDGFHPDMVVRAGGITIELSGGAARNLLESIGEAIRHAV